MYASPLLSILVVNWNVRELLRACLRAVEREMLLAPEEYEIIVIDNASSDLSAAMVREEFPAVRLIENHSNVGFALANNQAWPLCRGEYLLLLNPDTVVRDHAVDVMLDWMSRHREAGILGCRLLNSDGSFQRAGGGAFPTLRNLAGSYLLLDRVLPAGWAAPAPFLERDRRGTFEIDWVSGAAMLCRRTAVGSALFDERFFMFGEDMELCERIRRNGWRVYYTGDATIVHHHGQSMEKQDSPDVLAMLLKGPRAFFLMHHGRVQVWAHDLILFTGYLLRWVIFRTLSLCRREARYRRKANTSRRNANFALRILLRRS
jgi:N-acetylglucosaminyl-diphospho-decaprenol L-rhamnosyltransferase